MADKTWKCSCGQENTGDVCSACGKAKDGATVSSDALAQAMQMQMQMEERLRQEQREHNKAVKDYDNEVASVPKRALKKWGSSWIVLVLAILVSVSALFTLISTITGFKKGFIKIIGNIIGLLIAALVCAGFWKAWVECRKPDDQPYNVGGIKMLRGVFIYKKVIMYITMSFVMLIVIILFALLKGVTDIATGAASAATGADTSGINMSITTILALGLVAAVVAFAVQIVYYVFIGRFVNQVLGCFTNSTAPTQKVTMAAVFFFIIGGFSLISTIMGLVGQSMMGALLDTIFSEVSSVGKISGAIEGMIKIDVFGTISDIVNAATFIFAGLLALRFNKLNTQISTDISAVPTPDAM